MQVFMTKSGQKHSRLNSCKHKRRDYWITTGRISRFCSSIVPLHCSLAVAGRLKARSCAERKGPRDVATSELLKSARLVKKRTRHSEQPTTRNLHLNDNGMLLSMLSGLLLALKSISTTFDASGSCLFTSNPSRLLACIHPRSIACYLAVNQERTLARREGGQAAFVVSFDQGILLAQGD